MKRFRWPAVFLSGGLVSIVSMLTLSVLWIDLAWRKPVADWLLSIGLPGWLVARWAMVWVHTPDWLIAVLLGVAAGLLCSRQWLKASLVAAAGFCICPHIYLLLSGLHPAYYFDSAIVLQTLVWGLVALPLMVLASWLASRRRGSTQLPAANVAAAG